MLLKKKEEIEAWLNLYKINDYELIEDKKCGYIVNVNEDVDLYDKELNNIDITFNKIEGDFICNNNKFKSLKGFPKIVNGNLDCSHNELETLEGCPKIVKGDFDCSYNKLISLKSFPKKLNGSFFGSYNNLKSLEGCAEIVNGMFDCGHNELETLEGCPEIIKGAFFCRNNFLKIEGLKYLPKEIGGVLVFMENNVNLTNEFNGIHNFEELRKKIDYFCINEEKENLLNIININNLHKDKIIKKI